MDLKFFPSFFDKPQKIQFIEQEKDEVVELFLREHGIVNLPWILASLAAFTLPVITIRLEEIFNLNIISAIPIQVFVGGLVIWYMLVVAYTIEKFLFWYFNIYIVTNLHVIDVNFYNLTSRDILTIDLKNIETISSSVKGVFGSLFYFGDIIIQTAAETHNIGFLNVPKPDLVADRIEDLKRV
ncbi:hypothetical protein HYW46_06720 [Candidatus Daviesbacteria bacterium]|nr:hypothetical protein [Candidatus Daviesbacteria bacterium]